MSIEWLQFGLNSPRWATSTETEHAPALGDYREIPIIDWPQIAQFDPLFQGESIPMNEKILCPLSQASAQTFALRVIGDSMATPYGRSYPEGMIIFIDPTQQATPGQRVIAKTDKGYTFKELAEDEFAELYLRPLNPNPAYQPIFEAHIHVCGVVIGGFQAE
ncbi:MAG: LexA repressor [Candidatus Celerinatantimonas neptuna]|nr:MAG: LexA repressor [Candidatus Celerinatantimonas neptuna]